MGPGAEAGVGSQQRRGSRSRKDQNPQLKAKRESAMRVKGLEKVPGDWGVPNRVTFSPPALFSAGIRKNMLFHPHSKSSPSAQAELLTPHSISHLGFRVNARHYTFPSVCCSRLFPSRPHSDTIDLISHPYGSYVHQNPPKVPICLTVFYQGKAHTISM